MVNNKLKCDFCKPFRAWIRKRLNNNKNAIISINGPTGSGKSWASLALAELISFDCDSNFSPKTNLDFSFTGLLKKSMLPINNKKGTVFIFEEAGAVGGGGSNRQWQSKANIYFNSFLQTSRHRNQILIFNTPHFCYLDSASRKLVHMQIEILEVNKTGKYAISKPYLLQINSRTGKTYFKLMRVRTLKEGLFRIDHMRIPKPTDESIIPYEKMKLEYTTQLNKMIIESSEENKQKNTKCKIDPDILKGFVEKGLNNRQIAEKFNVHLNTVKYQKIKHKLDKKSKKMT